MLARTMATTVGWTSAPTLRDEAQSVWHNLNLSAGSLERVVAPVSTVSSLAAPVSRPSTARANEWPPPATPTEPILIEVVRDTDDEWHAVIDGQRCSERFAVGNATTPSCGLPPPIAPDRPIAPDTTSRKVVLTCRLEKEALAPARVDLVIEQVVHSVERRDKTYNNQDERDVLERYELKPYSISEPEAPAFVLPYPFACVPQSAFGIVNYAELEKYLERQEQHEDRIRRGQTGTLFDEKQPAVGEARTHKVGGEKVSAPAAAADLLDIIIRAYDQLVAWETKRRSAGIIGAEAFGLDSTAEFRIEGIRYMLREHGESTALALWDALAFGPDVSSLLGTQQPLKQTIQEQADRLEQQQQQQPLPPPAPIVDGHVGDEDGVVIDIRGEDGDGVLTTASDTSAFLGEDQRSIRTKLLDAVRGRLEQWRGLSYEFLYDRMLFENRQATHLRLEYRIEITEADGTVRSLTIAPYRWYAYVAHAVYTRVERDEERLRVAVHNTLQVLNKVAAKQRLMSIVRDYTYDATVFPSRTYAEWSAWLNERRWYRQRYKSSGAILNRMANSLLQMTIMCGFMTGPAWPEPAPAVAEAPPTPLVVPTHARVLPQIVRPKANMRLPQLKVPANTDAPDDWVPPVSGRESWWTWWSALVLASLFGYAVGVPVAIWAYASTMTGYAIGAAQATIAAAQATASAAGPVGGGLASVLEFAAGYVPVVGPAVALLARTVAKPLVQLLAGTGAGSFVAGAATEAASDYAVGAMAQGIYSGVVTGLPHFFALRNTIVAFARRRVQRDETRQRAYDRSARQIRGIPVMSTLQSARVAIHNLHLLAGDMFKLIYAGERYRLKQSYTRIAPGSEALVIPGRAPYSDDLWDSVPNSGLLLLMPPVDVVDAVFDATEMRRIEVESLFRIVGGASSNGAPQTLAELGAHVAHAELLTAMDSRRLPIIGETLMGSASAQAQRAAERAGALVLAAYGSTSWSTATTHVYGNDDLWSCLPGGPIARLAVRHTTVFSRANANRLPLQEAVQNARRALEATPEYANLTREQQLVADNEQAFQASRDAWNQAIIPLNAVIDQYKQSTNYTDDGLKTQIEQRDAQLATETAAMKRVWDNRSLSLEVVWSAKQQLDETAEASTLAAARARLDLSTARDWASSNRAHIDAFVKFWRAEAVRITRGESRSKGVSTTLTELLKQTARSSERMMAFADGGSVGIGALVAASATPRIVRLSDPSTIKLDHARASAAFGTATGERPFIDQAGWVATGHGTTTNETISAAWAARRADIEVLAQLPINGRDEVDSLVSKLAGLNVVTTAPVHYYCPTGIQLASIPGTVPFNVNGDATRMVWLSMLSNALLMARHGTTTTAKAQHLSAAHRIVENNNPRGIERHPLIITSIAATTVGVFLSRGGGRPASVPVDANGTTILLPDSLYAASRNLATSADGTTGRWVRDTTTQARSVCFNADRYKYAVSLAIEQGAGESIIVVEVRKHDHIASVALAIALSMYTADTGRAPPSVLLEYQTDQEVDVAEQALDDAKLACDRAIASGCKVVHLSELCVVFAQYA